MGEVLLPDDRHGRRWACVQYPNANGCEPQQALPLQTQELPSQKKLQLRVMQNLNLHTAPDPHSDKALGPPSNDFIPTNAIVERDLSTACLRRDVPGAVHTIWCRVIYDGHVGWANAFYLGTGSGPLSCSIDQTSFSCALAAPTSNKETNVAWTISDLTLRTERDPSSEKVLENIPKGSQVTTNEPCKVWMGSGRGAQDADNVWCQSAMVAIRAGRTRTILRIATDDA